VPGTRCGARPDASKQAAPNRCQAPGAAPGRMLANRVPKSVPGSRCGPRPDASKHAVPNRCQAPGADPGRMLANRLPQIGARHPVLPKSVPGTPCCGARSDASKQAAPISARHPVRTQTGC